MTTFDAARTGTGTNEWAEKTENIQRGCSNNCLYCYAAENAGRFKLRSRADWPSEELTKRAYITSYPKREGVVMLPSAHDITPFNLEPFQRVARLILAGGNRLLIVSKPRVECIRRLANALAEFKPQVMFRFSIGSMDPRVAGFWEPGAPAPAERVEALKLAFEAGYRTSVSAEPLLGGLATAQGVLAAVRPYTSDTVWIGKINKARRRVDMSIPQNAAAVREIEEAQCDSAILNMHAALVNDPIVRWKDSVTDVVASAAGHHKTRGRNAAASPAQP
jgi:DNA repair photolyase